MHRLLVDSEQLESDIPVLPKDALNHLKVLRPKDGEEIELFDGKGRWRIYRYVGAAKELESLDAHFHFSPSPKSLTLFACVTKGSRWDWTIEKATELGVTRIVPVISDRTIVRIDEKDREAKCARWTRIAEDAARQSDAKWIPKVLVPVTFVESLALVKETHCFVGALTTPSPLTIGEILSNLSSANSSSSFINHRLPYALYVGPEGDFTLSELDELIAIATPVSFGSTILRAETAAIYGVSVLKSYIDLFKE